FGGPIAGTYPFWYDPSYWQEGMKVKFDWRAQMRTISRSARLYLELAIVHLYIAAPFLLFLVISVAPTRLLGRAFGRWELTVPAVVCLILYSLVYTEFRYVAPQVSILWLI